jgi:hypothetical protein
LSNPQFRLCTPMGLTFSFVKLFLFNYTTTKIDDRKIEHQISGCSSKIAIIS